MMKNNSIHTMCPEGMTVSQTITALLAKPELAGDLVELQNITTLVQAAANNLRDTITAKNKAETIYNEAYHAFSAADNKYNEVVRKQADVFVITMKQMMEK